MKEKLQEYALIAEIIGGIAIVLSLVFVGYEVQQTNRIQIQSTTQSIITEYSTRVAALSEDAGLACVYVRGMQDYSGMTGTDRLRFSAWWVAVLRIVEDMYFLEKDGAIDPQIWSGIVATMSESMNLPGLQQWFGLRSDWFSEEFQGFLRGMIGEVSPDTVLERQDPECHTRAGVE